MKILKQKMKKAVARQEFEQAAHWRDLIYTIEQIKEKPKFISVGLENKDIFGFSRAGENAALYVFLMRKGKVIESEDVFFQEKRKVSDREILSARLEKFYRERRDVPDKILLPFGPPNLAELSEILFSQKRKKTEIIIPRKGKNKKLVDLANSNADMLIREKSKGLLPLTEISKVLGLKSIPRHIEGFDISNIGGKESVGSLVVFENGEPSKDDYRKYKIRTVEGPDDVASIREVVRRRYTRLLNEKKALPDLILVDGGKGQLNAASGILEDMGLRHLPVASLAKKEEIIFTPFRKDGIRLDRTSHALKLFQNIRNEAHRFAISFHRLRRKKKSFESLLDDIPGLGKKRKAALLANYKGTKEILKAPLEDLEKLIGLKTAKSLRNKIKS